MTPRQAFLLGLRSVLPLLLGVAPFGVIYGVIALQSGIPVPAAVAMSSIVFAGSAQFLLAQLAGAGAPLLLSAGAVGLINLRHALYSASVAPLLARLPRRWKLLLAYLLTDEAYAAAIPHLLPAPGRPRREFALIFAAVGIVTHTDAVYFAGSEMAGVFRPGWINECTDAVFAVAGNALRGKGKRENNE